MQSEIPLSKIKGKNACILPHDLSEAHETLQMIFSARVLLPTVRLKYPTSSLPVIMNAAAVSFVFVISLDNAI